MDFEQELKQVAEEYTREGYEVVRKPGANDLPAFAADWNVDIVARRGTQRVIAQLKENRDDVASDPNVSRYAAIANAQQGWRYDLIVLKPEDSGHRSRQDLREPTRDQIEEMLSEAEMILGNCSARGAFLLAWAGMEAAMRLHAQRSGIGGTIGTQPTVLIRELYGSGSITREEFERLDPTRVLRTEVAHGLAPLAIAPEIVQVVIETARKLLEGSDALQPLAG